MLDRRLGMVASKYNVNMKIIIKLLDNAGFTFENKPTFKLSDEMLNHIDIIFLSNDIDKVLYNIINENPYTVDEEPLFFKKIYYKSYSVIIKPHKDSPFTKVFVIIYHDMKKVGYLTILKGNKHVENRKFVNFVIFYIKKIIENKNFTMYLNESYVIYFHEKSSMNESLNYDINNDVKILPKNINMGNDRSFFGYNSQTINDAFEGDPENYWNID